MRMDEQNKRYEEYKNSGLEVDEIIPFSGPMHNGVEIKWASPDIGFGSYFLYRSRANQILWADSECMDAGDDKAFLMALMDLVKEKVLQEAIIER